MRNPRIFLYIFISTFFLFIICSAKQVSSNRWLLKYDNYEDRKEIIHIKLKNNNLENTSFRKITKLETDMTVSNSVILNKDDSLYNFIYQQELISGWLILKYESDSTLHVDNINTREKVKKSKTEAYKSFINKTTLLGKVNISENFTSVLFQTEYNTSLSKEIIKPSNYILKLLYLINFKDQKVLSMVQLASNFSGEYESTEYSILSKEGTFSLINGNSKRVIVKFIINSHGKVVIF